MSFNNINKVNLRLNNIDNEFQNQEIKNKKQNAEIFFQYGIFTVILLQHLVKSSF